MPTLDALHAPAGGGRHGRRWHLVHLPDHAVPRAVVLYLHPFAEEMHKSRRMAAQQARSLAHSGCVVLQPDLRGCGDDDDDFGDATWEDWVQDGLDAARALAERHDAPLWLWGLRSGALLASAVAQRLPVPCNFLFWQPVTSGRTMLQQFLRLKVAAEMLDGRARGAMDALQRELREGRAVEVAGYRLHPGMAAGLEQARLVPPPGARRGARVAWFELTTGDTAAGLAPAAARTADEWRAAGFDLGAHVVGGPPFWQTTDIEDAPALLQATDAALWAATPGAAAAVARRAPSAALHP